MQASPAPLALPLPSIMQVVQGGPQSVPMCSNQGSLPSILQTTQRFLTQCAAIRGLMAHVTCLHHRSVLSALFAAVFLRGLNPSHTLCPPCTAATTCAQSASYEEPNDMPARHSSHSRQQGEARKGSQLYLPTRAGNMSKNVHDMKCVPLMPARHLFWIDCTSGSRAQRSCTCAPCSPELLLLTQHPPKLGPPNCCAGSRAFPWPGIQHHGVCVRIMRPVSPEVSTRVT
uniref:Uncharacterized protein n=1 Tax=Dunaliella tertiolecta TaxID=3047 RepID=A0A7S3VIM7_DUNTE